MPLTHPKNTPMAPVARRSVIGTVHHCLSAVQTGNVQSHLLVEGDLVDGLVGVLVEAVPTEEVLDDVLTEVDHTEGCLEDGLVVLREVTTRDVLKVVLTE